MKLATKVNAYNVYLDGNKLVGISDEVTLPDFEALTETLSGAGILGEIDEPLLGHFKASEMEIPFRTLEEHMFRLASMSKALNLTLRASTQTIDTGNINTGAMPSRIVVKGKNKAITGGKLKQGEGTGSSIKIEVTYILIEVDKTPMFELDKLNFVYKVKGVDLMKTIREQV